MNRLYNIDLVDEEGEQMPSRDDILKRDFSEEFVTKMKNAIEMSYYKYGNASKTYPELAQARKSIRQRLAFYERTHNTEYLVDVANFAMLEFMFPSYSDAKFNPTDSDQSPGLADGISYKQMMEELK